MAEEKTIKVIRHFAIRLYVSQLSDDDALYKKWYVRMPEDRRKNCDRFRNEADRRRCVTAYALLVYALKDLIDENLISLQDEVLSGCIKDGTLPIEHGPDGKPFFSLIPVCFSISHSNDRVAVALSSMDVGCDVEKIKEAAFDNIAERFFAKNEYEYLSYIQADEERAGCFTTIWTLKESVIKCSGEGMRRGLGDFSLIDDEGKMKDTVELDGKVYHVRTYPQENGYSYSVCGKDPKTEEEIRYIRAEALMI